MTKARNIANLASDGSALADGTINYTDITGTPAPFDPATLAAVATTGAYGSLSGTPAAALPLTGGTLSGTLSTPALNIGGTQVISNARALTNVASIDATTAASIMAGGVGGSTVHITDNAAVSGTTITVSFTGGYKRYIVVFNYVIPTINNLYPYFRFTDSSGTTITGSEYTWAYASSYSGDHVIATAVQYATSIKNELVGGLKSAYFEFIQPYATNTATGFEYRSFRRDDVGAGRTRVGSGAMTTVERNNSVVFFWSSGGFATQGTYDVWGVL